MKDRIKNLGDLFSNKEVKDDLKKIIDILENGTQVNEAEGRIFREFRRERGICGNAYSRYGGVKPESLISSIMGIIDELLDENNKLKEQLSKPIQAYVHASDTTSNKK